MKKLFKVLAVSAMGLLLATSCSKSDEEQIKSVSMDFLTALDQQNFDKAKKCATPESAEAIDAVQSLAAMFGAENNENVGKAKYAIQEVVINGEEAEATYIDENDAEANPSKLELKKVDGKWLVQFKKEGMGGGDEEPMTEDEGEETNDLPTEEEMAQAEANIPE